MARLFSAFSFFCLNAMLFLPPLFAADVVSTWNGIGNWSNPARWSSNPLFPDNGNGGLTFDAIINGGIATLDQNITIEVLTFSAGSIDGGGDLSAATLNWTSGIFEGSGMTTINGGMISGNSQKILNERTLSIAGNVEWSAGEILNLPSLDPTYGTFVVQNGATFTASGANASNRNLRVNLQVDSGGTFLTTGFRATYISDFDRPAGTAINNGLIELGPQSALFMTGGSGDGTFIVKENAGLYFELLNASEFNYTGSIVLENGFINILTFFGAEFDLNLPSYGTGQFKMNGTKLVNSNEIAPGIPFGDNIGQVEVEGNYEQTSAGKLTIEIEGVAPNQIDKLSVIGAAELGGTLLINATNLTMPVPGTTFEILAAGSLAPGEIFEAVETIGNDDIFFAPIYNPSNPGSGTDGGSGGSLGDVAVGVYYNGDMNRNGLIDEPDVQAFAVALTKPIQYFSTYYLFGSESGDLNNDGRLDFDDIEGFAALISGTGATAGDIARAIERELNAVPEPSSIALLLIGFVGMLRYAALARRGGR